MNDAMPPDDALVPITAASAEAILVLNNEHAEALSLLQMDELMRLVSGGFFARTAADGRAFLLAFDETADYQSPNYRWFRARYPRFVYIDRVVVTPAARGRGLARSLYDALFRSAMDAGQDRIVCEVNIQPPNLASDAFHERLGFREVGTASIHDGTKTVRYLERSVKL